MRAVRHSWYPLEALADWLARGAELRVDIDRGRAYLRDDAVAMIITWEEQAELRRRAYLVVAGTWSRYLVFRTHPAAMAGGGTGAPTPEAARGHRA